MQDFRALLDLEIIRGENPLTVGTLVLVLLLVVVGYLLSKLLEKVLSRRLARTDMRPDAILTVQRVLFYVLIVGVALTALSLLNIPITAFAFLTGAVAIGVGFGAQNILNNFISGWILMTERPVRIGDFIVVDEHTGTVERIGNRSTRIRRVDGVHIMVPNSQMLERTVINWTLVDQRIRTTIRVGVAYGSPTRHVEELIRRIIRETPDVLTEPAPVVVFEDFGDSALVFDAFFWCEIGGSRELRQIRSDIRHRLTDTFAAEGIVVAYPQRDLHVDSPQPLKIELVNGKGDRD